MGWQYLRDKNSHSLRAELFGNVLPIDDAAALGRYDITYTKADSAGVYVLTAAVRDGYKKYRLTVDATKGFNIVKTECLRRKGGKYYEINITLKQHPDGTWFPAERTRTNFSKDGKSSVQYRVKVTEVDFSPEIPEQLFQFEFPLGTKVWDGSLKMWFDVGGSPDVEGATDLPADLGESARTLPGTTTGKAEGNTDSREGENERRANKDSQPTEQEGSIGRGVPLLILAGVAVLIVAFIVIVYRVRRTKR